jgi:CHRD domain
MAIPRVRTCVVALAVSASLGCAPEQSGPTDIITLPLFAKGGNGDMNINTHLGGEEEVLVVPEGAAHPSDSRAQGQAIFRVNSDGTVDVRLIASNIDNVVQSHIHCGRFGENGPIRIWLFPTVGTSGSALTGPTGSQNGILAEGTFDPTGLVCPAANVGTTMPVLDAMRSGLAYVNVHTNDGVAPTNTGPGDFPGGEIRGQVGDKNNP